MAVSQPPVTGAPGTGFLSATRWERFAPLTGVIAVILFIAGALVLDGAREPAEEAPPAAYLAYFDRETDTIFAGSSLFFVGLVFLVWFAGALRARLAEAEGGAHRLASVSFGGAVLMAALMLGALGSQISGAFAIDEDVALSPDAAQAIYYAGQGMFYGSFFGAALLTLAAGVVMVRTGVMARWLGWATFALGVILLVPWVGWAAFIFLMPIWAVLVSVMLFRSGSGEGAAT